MFEINYHLHNSVLKIYNSVAKSRVILVTHINKPSIFQSTTLPTTFNITPATTVLKKDMRRFNQPNIKTRVSEKHNTSLHNKKDIGWLLEMTTDAPQISIQSVPRLIDVFSLRPFTGFIHPFREAALLRVLLRRMMSIKCAIKSRLIRKRWSEHGAFAFWHAYY